MSDLRSLLICCFCLSLLIFAKPGLAEALDGGAALDAGTIVVHPRTVRGTNTADAGTAVRGGMVPRGAGTPPPKGAPHQPPPKPLTDEEKASALLKKHQYDQACPLLEKIAKATPDHPAPWEELGQCELHRGHHKAAIDAASHAALLGDRSVRESAYVTLRAAGQKIDLPPQGCVWLPESPGGICGEQMWGCGYDWETPTPNGRTFGHAVTFGDSDDERDVLEEALRDGSALRPQLAAEWKALVDLHSDELACASCNQHAVDSADGLVNARAAACFRKKTGHVQAPEVCAQQDADCEVYTSCLDAASSLAKKVDTDHNRSLWPEASEVINAAHKVCDATCGVVSTVRCQVVALDACRGLIGYACVDTKRGRRPTVQIGEISIEDGTANWNDARKSY